MKANFAESLELVLEHEGGYVDHPKDPGGATNKGVTQRIYNNFRRSRGRSAQSVMFLEAGEVEAIYKLQYWDAVRGDLLPSGLDYAMFDFAVNSGVSRAVKYLQGIVGVKKDGVIGAMTLGAIHDVVKTINTLCDWRMSFLRRLPTFLYFGKGWAARVEGRNPKKVDGVREIALDMAQ
jgi:lysozyme family protein